MLGGNSLLGGWNSLLREAMDAPSLEVFKVTLDESLGRMMWWVAALPITKEGKKLLILEKLQTSCTEMLLPL